MTPWNPWKVAAIAMMLVMATALVTGLVVANWSGSDADRRRAVDAAAPAAKPAGAKAGPAGAIDACNRIAAVQVGQKDKTTGVVKDPDERYGEAYASCMRSSGYPG